MTAFTSDLSGGLSFTGARSVTIGRPVSATAGFTGRFVPLKPYRHAVAYIYANYGVAAVMVKTPDSSAYIYENVVPQVGDGLPNLAGLLDAERARFQKVLHE